MNNDFQYVVRSSKVIILLFVTNSLHTGREFASNNYIFPVDGMTNGTIELDKYKFNLPFFVVKISSSLAETF